MIEDIETLIALEKFKTMSAASSHLRITQSAVSKRLASLEHECGRKLFEKKGRRVELTAFARSFIKKVSPHLGEIRSAMREPFVESKQVLVIGVSESILSSWGASKILPIAKKMNVELEFHCHRSPTVLQKVEAGIYDIGFCAGKLPNPRGLHSLLILKEEMVMISKEGKYKNGSPFMCVEESSATWKAVKNKFSLKPQIVLESFFSVAQLANQGLLPGLVPRGVTESLRIDKKKVLSLTPKLHRPIQLVLKKTKFENEAINQFIDLISKINI